MYKRYYDGYARMKPDAGEIIVPENVQRGATEKICALPPEKNDEISLSGCDCKNSGLNLPWDTDDLILIGVLLFLLFDKKGDNDNDDNNMFLLLIVGFVLLSDIL